MPIDNPIISVVTPSFNSAKYIKDCIQSVLAQKYSNFEHIIIDGGSTDGTIDILKDYPHLKWISEPDEGQSDALNKGFKLAKGSLLCWLNSDDILLSNVFEKVETIYTNEKFDILYGSFIFIDPQNVPLRLMPSLPLTGWLIKNYGCYIPTSGAFMDSKIFSCYNLYLDTKLKIAMDQDFYIRAYNEGLTFTRTKSYLNGFRLHGNNQSQLLTGTETIELFQRYGFKNFFGIKPKIWFSIIRYFGKLYYSLLRFFSGSYFERILKANYFSKRHIEWFTSEENEN